jgi:hypothetical protein
VVLKTSSVLVEQPFPRGSDVLGLELDLVQGSLRK